MKEIFGVKTFINGFDPKNSYTHRMEGGVAITVNAGNKAESEAAAISLADAFDKGGQTALIQRADTLVRTAHGAHRPFACTVSRETPEQVPV